MQPITFIKLFWPSLKNSIETTDRDTF